MSSGLPRRGSGVWIFVGATLILLGSQVQQAEAQAPISPQLEKSAQVLTGPDFDLKYHFDSGEEILSKVIHLVTMDTKIEGTAETVETRSTSVRRWKITDVDDRGNVTFLHYVDSAKMWQKVSGRPEIRFDSEAGEPPHELYRNVAKTIGVPLATITISPRGVILGRKSDQPNFNPGIGELTVPLPGRPVKVGQKWYVPDELRIAGDDGRYKRVQTRQLYTLQKVQTGIATIKVATQVLTPIRDAKIRSKLIQRLQHGTIKFDLDAGRVRSKQMDLNERVIGFNGAASIMHYLTRFTEEWSVSDGIDKLGATLR